VPVEFMWNASKAAAEEGKWIEIARMQQLLAERD
jgi:hypothetical protein